MNPEQYQQAVNLFARIPSACPELLLRVVELNEEAGEVAGKIKRYYNGHKSPPEEQEVMKELGDVMWNVARICTLLGTNLSAVMQMNIDKLNQRAQNGTIIGTGDER